MGDMPGKVFLRSRAVMCASGFEQTDEGDSCGFEYIRADFASEQSKRLEKENRMLKRMREKYDCQFAGDYVEVSGKHCPIGEPCVRCQLDLAAERERELVDALHELTMWARDIAGDCDDEQQRENEWNMIERMDGLLAKFKGEQE